MEVLTPNKSSGETFKLNDNQALDNLCKSFFYLDVNLLKIIFEKKLNFYNLKTENLRDHYEILHEELKRLFLNNDISILGEISRRISICEDLIRIKNIIQYAINDIQIFLPFIFDFRGRLYYKSDASPTFYSEIRYCMYEFNNVVIRRNEEVISNKITQLLRDHFYLLSTLHDFNFEALNERGKESVLWVLVAAAECEKTKLGREVTLEKFINHGICLINNFLHLKTNWDFNKELHI